MSGPGYSITELIGFVDWTVKFIIELKQVPDQILALKRKLEVSQNQLEGLASILQEIETCDLSIYDQAAASLREFRHELLDVLNDTLDLLKRFHPDNASKFVSLSNLGNNVRWMVDRRYQGNVKSLQDKISEIERNIAHEIGILNL
jgi:conjugal transfer/entry exclusion protein